MSWRACKRAQTMLRVRVKKLRAHMRFGWAAIDMGSKRILARLRALAEQRVCNALGARRSAYQRTDFANARRGRHRAL